MSHMSGNHCLSQDCNVEMIRYIACNRVCAMRHMLCIVYTWPMLQDTRVMQHVLVAFVCFLYVTRHATIFVAGMLFLDD